MKYCLGPDPDPHRPKYRLPAGACDTHCHVFGPAAKFPYAPDRTYTPPDAPKEQLRWLHDRIGVSRAVIVQASCHGTDNRATIDAIATSSGAWRGVAIVNGSVTDAELQAMDRGGIRAVRFNFVAHLGGTPDLDVFDKVLDRIEPLGWHVVLHLDAGDIVTFADRIDRIRVPFIIDHMGRVQARHGLDQQPFRRLLDLMRNPRAWIKICGPERVSSAGPPFHDAIPFAQALIAAAPDRVLWGTDYPHPNVTIMPNDGDLVDLFAAATDGDEALRRRILVENPDRLYRFDTKVAAGAR